MTQPRRYTINDFSPVVSTKDVFERKVAAWKMFGVDTVSYIEYLQNIIDSTNDVIVISKALALMNAEKKNLKRKSSDDFEIPIKYHKISP